MRGRGVGSAMFTLGEPGVFGCVRRTLYPLKRGFGYSADQDVGGRGLGGACI